MIRNFGTAAGVVALLGLVVSAGGQAAAAEVSGWRTATTEHFVVQAVLDDAKLAHLGERCEELLGDLRAKWFDDGVAADWAPRCLVVVVSTPCR